MDVRCPWELCANVTVCPVLKLGQTCGVVLELLHVVLSADDVNAALECRRAQLPELVVMHDCAAANGALVELATVGTIAGMQLAGGSSCNYSLELGSNSFIPGFVQQLVGHKSGDVLTVNVLFPVHTCATDLAGMPAAFKTTIHVLCVCELPELDEAFACDLAAAVELLAALMHCICMQ